MDFVIFLKMYECILAFDNFEVLFAFLILKVFFLSIWTDQAVLKKKKNWFVVVSCASTVELALSRSGCFNSV